MSRHGGTATPPESWQLWSLGGRPGDHNCQPERGRRPAREAGEGGWEAGRPGGRLREAEPALKLDDEPIGDE